MVSSELSVCRLILKTMFRTFLSNMKAFGLDNDICREFLQKMSTIGDLTEGNDDDNSGKLQPQNAH